jgi:rhodanese-related sulfurtransferase
MTMNASIGAQEVSVEAARKGLKEGKFRSVVDVRSPSEYQAGHYRDAISFPLNTINYQTTLKKQNSERLYSPTLVYCKTGKRSKQGAELLSKYGIYDVYYVSVPYWKLERD